MLMSEIICCERSWPIFAMETLNFAISNISNIFAMIFQMYLLCRMDRYCAVWISMTTFGEISCRATLTSSFQIKSSSKNQGLYSQVWKKFMNMLASNQTWYKICKNIKLKYLNMGPINGFKDKVWEACLAETRLTSMMASSWVGSVFKYFSGTDYFGFKDSFLMTVWIQF